VISIRNFGDIAHRIYIIINNVEYIILNESERKILSNLSKIPNLHLVMSLDKINLQGELESIINNIIFIKGDTFDDYIDEATSNSTKLRSVNYDPQQHEGVKYVLNSITKKVRKIFFIFASLILEGNIKISRQQFLVKVEESFISSTELDDNLRELIDHELIIIDRNGSNTFYKTPIENEFLQKLLNESKVE